MVNKAKSQELKNQINRKEVDDLKAYTSKLYVEEQHRSQIWALKAEMGEAKDAYYGKGHLQAHGCRF